MKKAFTLIELLIVVVVLVTLMMIVFKLGNIGEEAKARTVTIERIQRLENALSGYNAAFGMYPPVRIHGSRNIYLKIDDNGLQNSDGEENTDIWGWCSSNGEVTNRKAEGEAWRQVEAACRSQPVACEFPFDDKYQDMIQAACEELQTWAEQSECMPDSIRQIAQAGFDDGVTENIGRHAKNKGKIEWSDIQLFKFGALSYLLPRYLIMMNGDKTFFTDYAQWTGNNQEPCDPLTGGPMGWSQVQNYANSDANSDLAHVANAPSQAVCARWMANFEGALACNHSITLFGVNIKGGGNANSLPFWSEDGESGTLSGTIYNPNGYNGAKSGFYVLDRITIKDGWGNELYYYSPAPYQSYTVWSAGRNGRTFPPWISRDKLPSDVSRCAAYWTKDDIVNMTN